MKRSHYIVAMLVCALTGAGAVYWIFFPNRPPDVFTHDQTILVDGAERSFRVVVPKNLMASAPVVVAFHGIGDSPESMAEYSELDRLADNEGFLLIYPSGQHAMWSAINFDPESLDTNVDVRFFDDLLRHISEQHPVDLDRVYVMGMSNGATFVQILAHARSDVLAGVVAHSGPRPHTLPKPERAFPILLIVGENDQSVHAVKSDYEHYLNAGHETDLVIADGFGHVWTVDNNSTAWSFLRNCRLSP